MNAAASIAARGYASTLSAARPDAGSGAARGPADAFRDLAGGFMDTMKAGEAAAMGAMTGTTDSHSLVEALSQTELAIETAVTVRDKVVEAYQEILRMPV